MARVMPKRRAVAANQVEGPRIHPTAILRGTLSAFVLSFALFAIVSILFAYTALPDAFMPLIATFAGVFSVVWGGFAVGRKATHGALLNGSIVGLLYGLVVLMLGILVLSEPLGAQVLWRMGGAIVCGAVGGLIAPKPKIRRRH
ncbi:MAG: TIGR04086 family membrane protein [Bacillota bacterium]|nr:TIGR04086 family membrane protein [Bacillota bacterium]